MPRPPAGTLGAATALAVLLTGCGATPTGANEDPPAKGYPVTVDNCGTRVEVDAPPERVVTLNQHATEVMLALGLQDRMVGTAYLDDAVLPEYEKAYREIPVLARRYPSFEKLLEADPDFVYAGFGSSAFDPAEGRGREELASAGIETYENREGCADPVTMGTVATEIRTIGRIFGVEQRAERLVSRIEKRLDSTDAALDGTEPVDVLVVDSIDATVTTMGGSGLGNEIVERAGGRNVFDDVDDAFPDVSAEQAAEREPERILILDYGDTSLAEKRKAIRSDPALADTPAVAEGRFASLPLSSTVVGIRAGDAVRGVAKRLHPGAF